MAEEQPQEPAAVEPKPLSYAELKKREPGVYEFTLSRTADDPRGKARYLELHGGRFKMERGKSRIFKFALPTEARTLAQLAEDGYTVEEGGPPDPERDHHRQVVMLGAAILAAWQTIREDPESEEAAKLKEALPEMKANFRVLTGDEMREPELPDAGANREEIAKPEPAADSVRRATRTRRTNESPEG